MLNLWSEGRVLYVRTDIPELLEGRYRNPITMIISKDRITDIFVMGKYKDYHCPSCDFLGKRSCWKVVDEGSGRESSGEGTKKSEHPESDARFEG